MTERIVFKSARVYMDIEKTLSIYRVDSAMGKSYIPYALRDVKGMPSILAYTSVIDYERLLRNPWVEGDDVIYFLDRYDVRHTDAIADLLKKTTGRCILVDAKDPSLIQRLYVPHACVYIERPDVRRFIIRNGDLYRGQSLRYK